MTDTDPQKKATVTTRKSECSQCGGIRNCDILGEHADRYGDSNYHGETMWYILKCRGCDHVFAQTISTNSEDLDYGYGEDGSEETTYKETIEYWPALSKRNKPEWMQDHGIDATDVEKLDAAMLELYGALENDLRMLAAIGIRTSFDIASELLGIDPNLPFDKKLDALINEKRIGPLDKDRLKTLVEAGSASVHRGWRPKPNELKTMTDVLEHFVYESFVAPARKKKLDTEAAKVKKTVPSRPPRVKSA